MATKKNPTIPPPMQDTNKKIEELTNEIKELRSLLVNTRIARGTQNGLKMQLEAGSALVLKDIQEHPGTVRQEIVERTHLQPSQVTKIVGELQGQEKLIKLGSRRTTRWFTPESLASLRAKP